MMVVEIPADVAKSWAEADRLLAADLASQGGYPATVSALLRRADLLDPKPPTLRDAVAQAVYDSSVPTVDRPEALLVADAVLAVVKARIEAVPGYGMAGVLTSHYRRAVLDLFPLPAQDEEPADA
jgi:hypothetical protein